MIRVVNPAPLDAVLPLYSAGGFMKPVAFRVLMIQAARSETVGFVDDDGRMIAAIMLYPCDAEADGEDLREATFVCWPDAARHVLTIVRAVRSMRAAVAQTAAVRVRARVRAGHRPGHRLARLCGLRLVAVEGAYEVHEWTSDDAICPRDQNPVHGAGQFGQ